MSAVRQVAALIWTEATPFVRLRVGIVLVLVVATSVLAALGPLALKQVVDALAMQSGGDVTRNVILFISLYVLSQWLARIAGQLRSLFYARVERRMSRTLSERLFAHIMRLPHRFHADRHTGGVSQMLTNGLQGYQMVFNTVVFSFAPIIAEITTVIFVLLQLGHYTFLVLFICALTSYLAAFTYTSIMTSRAARSAATAHVETQSVMTDCIMNYEAVKYCTAESAVQSKVAEALGRTEREWVRFYNRFFAGGIGVASIFAASRRSWVFRRYTRHMKCRTGV